MSAISIRPITKAVGATVEGIDLNRDLTPAVSDALYEALMKHHALVFRKQDLTPEAHVAFAESFGPVVPFHPSTHRSRAIRRSRLSTTIATARQRTTDGIAISAPRKSRPSARCCAAK
jgi:alpha-ketoglutarate-dependent taurine dioxygenase